VVRAEQPSGPAAGRFLRGDVLRRARLQRQAQPCRLDEPWSPRCAVAEREVEAVWYPQVLGRQVVNRGHPQASSAESMHPRKMSSTFPTPARPLAAMPHRLARPDDRAEKFSRHVDSPITAS
jgi:hypothetical protein